MIEHAWDDNLESIKASIRVVMWAMDADKETSRFIRHLWDIEKHARAMRMIYQQALDQE